MGVLDLRVAGEDDGANRGKPAAQLGDGLGAVHSRHHDVDEGDIRQGPLAGEPLQEFQGLGAVPGLPDGRDVREDLEERDDAAADDDVVVDDDDGQRGRGHRRIAAARASGKSALTWVPPSGGREKAMAPPQRAAR
jgi:hypothetical protein